MAARVWIHARADAHVSADAIFSAFADGKIPSVE
jgi:hypothetical protein